LTTIFDTDGVAQSKDCHHRDSKGIPSRVLEFLRLLLLGSLGRAMSSCGWWLCWMAMIPSRIHRWLSCLEGWQWVGEPRRIV
jgi:hypothetical protein